MGRWRRFGLCLFRVQYRFFHDMTLVACELPRRNTSGKNLVQFLKRSDQSLSDSLRMEQHTIISNTYLPFISGMKR